MGKIGSLLRRGIWAPIRAILPKNPWLRVLIYALPFVLLLALFGPALDVVLKLMDLSMRVIEPLLATTLGRILLLLVVLQILRRAGKSVASAEPEAYRLGDVVVDVASRTVRRNGQDLAIPPREFELLVALLRKAGAAMSRAELLRDVWGHKAEVETRTVDTHIAELRRKLEPDASHPEFILTVRKFGYRIDVGTDSGSSSAAGNDRAAGGL